MIYIELMHQQQFFWGNISIIDSVVDNFYKAFQGFVQAELGYGGLILGLSKVLLLPHLLHKWCLRVKSGQKWHENINLASLV